MNVNVRKFFILFLFFVHFTYSFTREDLLNPTLRQPCPPYITGDAFRAHCDFVLDETNSYLQVDKIQDRSTIFVGFCQLRNFFENYHSAIQGRYILVTHNTDYDYPGEYAKYLDDEKLIVWFSQNVENLVHPKLVPIPIGLGNRYTFHGDLSLLRQIQEDKPGDERKILLFMSFCMTHTERYRVNDLFKDKAFCTNFGCSLNYDKFLRIMTQSKFVLSPRGNGWDCHRIWEALYLGAIPIIRTSTCNEMFADLPVLIVNDWDDVTEEFLTKSYNEIKAKTYDLEKLDIQYWLNLIDHAKLLGEWN